MRLQNRKVGFLVLVLLIGYAVLMQTRRGSEGEHEANVNPLEEMLRVPSSVPRQEGTAAVILMDTSGSMNETVPDASGKPERKIVIARRAAGEVVRRFSAHAAKDPSRPLLVGIYEFSARDRQPACRPVISLGPPRAQEALAALDKMDPDGGTPIGDAMIAAKKDLDLTGMSRRHILVVTDGENNRGYSPDAVAAFLSTQAEADRASVYFIAFNVSAEKFNPVKEAGALVLAAENESDLNQTLDFVLTGKILAEQPAAATTK